VLLATAAAFLLTTGDSYLLSSATVTVYDLIARFREIGDRTKLNLQRLLVLIFALLSFVMIRFFPSVLTIQMFAYTIYGATITPALLGALLWKDANKWGGISSMIVGIVTTLISEFTITRSAGINSVVVSAPLAFLVLVVVSLLTKKKNSDAL
jgi:SSS family solute:Na+ symporter